ncbi:MAG: insulinase family protein, partial [Candidatus Eremiobacteraeota bacterium]|nr:insulinase family protein [Candidatus Eremiobacteraeota bacterium]
MPVAPLFDPSTIVRRRLANGLTILVRRDISAPVVAINTYVSAGYFDEPDSVVGVAHVLEHMFFKGTPRRAVGEIAKQTKAEGGYLNAHTIYDHTSYYAVLPASGFREGLDIQADAYANSLVDAGELGKELEVIIQEAKRKLDNPSAVTIESLYALLHDRHRVRRWRIGTEDGLRQLTRADVDGFYRAYYRPSNTVLAVVGDVHVDEAFGAIEQRYGDLPDGTVPRDRGPHEDSPTAVGPRYQELDGDVRQSQLALGWRTPGTFDPDTPRLDLVASVLGAGRASRLYRAVRERSLASSVSAYDSTPVELGIFVVHAEGDPAHLVDAARAAWAEIAALRANGVRADELDRVQRILEARALRRLETMEGQASWLAEWESLGGWERGERYREALLAAHPEEVTDAARHWLTPEAAAAVVYRPRGSASVASDASSFFDEIAGAAAVPVPPAAPSPTPVAVAPAPVLERVEAGVHVFRTAAGVPVLVVPKPGLRIVHLAASALGGAVTEPDGQEGLTALMAAASVKGTMSRSAATIAEEAERLGGSVGASAGQESVGWGMTVPTTNFAAAADLLADVVQHATFPDAAVDTERDVLVQDARTLRDDMYRWPLRLATETAFAGHPYGRPTDGTELSLAGLTPERVRAWHAAIIGGSPWALAVVGDVEPAAAAAVVTGAFAALRMAELPAIPPPVWPSHVEERVEPRDKRQTAIALLFPGAARRDPARFVAQL